MSNGVKRWVCSVKCKAFLKTEEDSDIITEIVATHNHEPKEEKVLNRNILSNTLKRKATDDFNEKPMKLIHKELRKGDVESLTNKDIMYIRKNMYYSRRQVFPKLPKNVEELHAALDSFKPTTNKEEQFLLVNNRENHIVMFSCKTNLEFLCDLDTIYVDGTFSYCPKLFLQLFTLHGLKGDHYIPLVFFLFPDKRKETYKCALEYAVSEAKTIGKTLNPDNVVADFEVAIHEEVREVWNHASLVGCRFHLGQSW